MPWARRRWLRQLLLFHALRVALVGQAFGHGGRRLRGLPFVPEREDCRTRVPERDRSEVLRPGRPVHWAATGDSLRRDQPQRVRGRRRRQHRAAVPQVHQVVRPVRIHRDRGGLQPPGLAGYPPPAAPPWVVHHPGRRQPTETGWTVASPRALRLAASAASIGGAAIIWLALLGPVIALLTHLSAGAIKTSLTTPGALEPLIVSLQSGAVTLGVLVLLGTQLAWLLARGKLSFPRIWEAGILCTLLMPPLVIGLLLIFLVDPYTPIGEWLGTLHLSATNIFL